MAKIIAAATKMLSGRLRVFSVAEKVFSAMGRSLPANQNIACAAGKVFVVPKIIRSRTNRGFSGIHKVFSVTEMILSSAVSYKLLMIGYLQRYEKILSVTEIILGHSDKTPSPLQEVSSSPNKTGAGADFMFVMN